MWERKRKASRFNSGRVHKDNMKIIEIIGTIVSILAIASIVMGIFKYLQGVFL